MKMFIVIVHNFECMPSLEVIKKQKSSLEDSKNIYILSQNYDTNSNVRAKNCQIVSQILIQYDNDNDNDNIGTSLVSVDIS